MTTNKKLCWTIALVITHKELETFSNEQIPESACCVYQQRMWGMLLISFQSVQIRSWSRFIVIQGRTEPLQNLSVKSTCGDPKVSLNSPIKMFVGWVQYSKLQLTKMFRTSCYVIYRAKLSRPSQVWIPAKVWPVPETPSIPMRLKYSLVSSCRTWRWDFVYKSLHPHILYAHVLNVNAEAYFQIIFVTFVAESLAITKGPAIEMVCALDIAKFAMMILSVATTVG